MFNLPMASADPTNFWWIKLEFYDSKERISAMRPDAIIATIFSPLTAFWSNREKIRLVSSCKAVISVARVVFRMSILRS